MRSLVSEKKLISDGSGENMPCTAAELIQFIQAAHVSQQTDWNFEARSGIILCAPPESLKTTIVLKALDNYNNTDCLSDMNARQFNNYRDRLLNGRFHTLAFLDYQKVWERDESTSANTEGIIRALTDEGWKGHPERSEFSMLARAFIVLCITSSMWEERAKHWERTGFSRRFLFMHYRFTDLETLVDAIGENHPYQLSHDAQVRWPSDRIPMTVDDKEFQFLRLALKKQVGVLVPLQFLKRIYNTLKWHYAQTMPNDKEGAERVFMNCMPLLKPEGGALVIKNPRPELVVSGGERRKKA